MPNLPVRVGLPANLKMRMATSDFSDSAWPLQTDSELYFYGGVSFEYKGSTISVKMGFKKGHYEPYVKNYKTEPVLIVAEMMYFVQSSHTDDVRFPAVMDIFGSEKNIATYLFWKDGRYQNLEFTNDGSDVYVYGLDETGNKREYLLMLDLPLLLQAWAENAKRYAMPYNDKTIYAVQQLLPRMPDGTTGLKDVFGWVLSKSSPLYHTTGLPLDFVELYHKKWDTSIYEYKPIAYSIPLGIALVKSEVEVSWNMRDITPEEISDALDDEAMDTAKR